MDPMNPSSLWWMDAAQAPVIAGLYWLLLGIKRDLDRRIEKGTSRHDDGLARTRDELAAFKLEVARTYVPLSLIRDVDRRLSEQLLRIEDKLENIRRDQEHEK